MIPAIVLAGGLGTRLRSVTKDIIPKPMVEVQGHPFLHWIFKYLKKQNISTVVLAVSHKGDRIQDYFEYEYLGIKINYSFEESPLGTGGAIKQAFEFCPSEEAFVINGDTFFPVNLNALHKTHLHQQNDISIALKHLAYFDRYGTVELNESNKIVGFKEKKYCSHGLINGGTYLMSKKVFQLLSHELQTFSIEKDLFEKELQRIKIGGYISNAAFIDIGIPEEYDRIQTMILE